MALNHLNQRERRGGKYLYLHEGYCIIKNRDNYRNRKYNRKYTRINNNWNYDRNYTINNTTYS